MSVAQELLRSLEQLNTSVKGISDSLADHFSAVEVKARETASSFTQAITATRSLTTATLSATTAVLRTPLAMTEMLGQMGAAAGKFVSAANPAEMERFQLEMKNLTASFGVGLQPLILAGQQVAAVFNEFVTELMPAIQPIMEELGAVMMDLARAVIEVARPIIQALIPIVKLLVDALRPIIAAVAPVLAQLGQVIADMLTALTPLIEIVIPPLITILRALGDTVSEVIQFMRRNSVSVLAMTNPIFGAMARLQQLAPQMGPAAATGDSRRTFAANQAQQIGIEEIGQAARRASFGAAAVAERQLEVSRGSLERLDGILAGVERMRALNYSVEEIRELTRMALNGMQQRMRFDAINN